MKQRPLFSVVYRDDHILGVDKSAGLLVGADRWDPLRERLDRLLSRDIPEKKVFIVHRIDRDTSGVVVFALDPETHRELSRAFETRGVKKRYIAGVHGRPGWNETVCDLPLVPEGNKRHQTIIDRYRGKASLTRFRLLGSAGNYSIVEALPETGRTHQIRVHLAALGYPVLCDELYGSPKPVFLSTLKRDWRGDPWEERPLLARLGLHAAEVELPGGLVVRAPLPRDMKSLISQMEKAAGRDFVPPSPS